MGKRKPPVLDEASLRLNLASDYAEAMLDLMAKMKGYTIWVPGPEDSEVLDDWAQQAYNTLENDARAALDQALGDSPTGSRKLRDEKFRKGVLDALIRDFEMVAGFHVKKSMRNDIERNWKYYVGA